MLNTRWFRVFAEHQVLCVLSSTYSCICLKANRKKRHVIMFQDELKENMSLPFFSRTYCHVAVMAVWSVQCCDVINMNVSI